MTLIIETDGPDADRADTLVADAQQAFDRAVRLLNDSCRQLEAMPESGEADVMKSVRQLNGAYILAMDIREKARAAGSRRFGEGQGGRLDLDAARVEIGLRLACLRERGAGRGVPVQSE